MRGGDPPKNVGIRRSWQNIKMAAVGHQQFDKFDKLAKK